MQGPENAGAPVRLNPEYRMNIKPHIKCQKAGTFNIDDWKAADAPFKTAEFADFQQGWTDRPSPDFRPAKAAAAWTDNALIVYAELCDDDIFNDTGEGEFNKIAIDSGDVFEIFLGPAGQDSYYEFHVSPRNQKIQLRLPFPKCFEKLQPAFKSSEAMLETFKIWSPVIQSRVRTDRAAGKWWVLVEIPFSMLVEKGPVVAGLKWSFSFCRYDYTRPGRNLAYSSTSPHSAINYHLVDEYGVLEFV